MTTGTAPQPGAPEPAAPPTAQPQQMSAEAPARPGAAPKAPGYAPAFGGVSGAAWVFRDLASI